MTIAKDNLNCKGVWGWLFGHKYRAKYSYGEPTIAFKGFEADTVNKSIKVMNASKRKVYHGDVCRRCGNIVNAQGN